MPSLSVRNLSDATHRALKARAQAHGSSVEAEVRAILDEAVRPPIRLGDVLHRIGQAAGGFDLQVPDLADRAPVDFGTADFDPDEVDQERS